MNTNKLRLGPLPKTGNLSLIFACPASLKAKFDQYAALHRQAAAETGTGNGPARCGP